ncbi:hypothetical protein CLOP_g22438 [Closterium sp. NIES-67]|nr:hypothetical protein CLOP_g22438 [Closterium sp. NIES-67]
MGVTCHVDEQSSFSRAALLRIVPLVDPESASFVVAERRSHFHLTFMVLRGFIADFASSGVHSVLVNGSEPLEGDICPFCPAQIWDAQPVLSSNICDTLECILARVTICRNGHIFGLYRR